MYFSLKRLARGIAAAALGLALASPLATAIAQTPPDVLVVGLVAEPKSLDPHASTAASDFQIDVNVYEGLLRFKPGTLEIEPALAESYTASEDGMSYTFKLRSGVKFHDGSELNAEAVKFNFDRIRSEGGEFPMAFLFSSIAEVIVDDPMTVTFKLSEPFAPLLANFAGPSALIVSPAAVEKSGEEFGRNPSGTGPFKFVTWESNRQVAIEANPDYWGTKPTLKGIVFRPITDANARVAELLAGGVDLLTELPADSVKQLGTDPKFKVYDVTAPSVWFLILNLKEEPLKDVRVRQALNYAINKDSLVNDVLQGTAAVADSPVPEAFNWAYNETLAPYPYDPEKAKALLAEAGYPDGFETNFLVTEGGSGMLDPVAMGTAIQADLAAVGVKANIQTYEWNTFLDTVNPGLEGKAGLAEMAWMTSDPDTLPFLTLRTEAWPAEGGYNSGYYSNPEVDKLLAEARSSADQAKRAELYKQISKLVYDDAPWVFVANAKANAVAGANIGNFQLEPSSQLFLANVTKTAN